MYYDVDTEATSAPVAGVDPSDSGVATGFSAALAGWNASPVAPSATPAEELNAFLADDLQQQHW